MDEGICIGPMTGAHLDAVVAIESAAFSNPWRRRDFQVSLARDNGVCRVVTRGGRLVGYAIGFLLEREFHLADFAVAPAERRQGVGRRALERLFAELDAQIQVVSLEVRMSNRAAIDLYRGLGFQTMAIRKDYYSRPREDALVMVKALRGRLSDWAEHALPGAMENRESA